MGPRADSGDAPVWPVVLDANVLLQAPIRDTLPRLAEAESPIVAWSADILAEVVRNFAAVSGPEDAPRRLDHLLPALHIQFPQALQGGYTALLPILPIAPHDRHVLGCAIVARARYIVTYNLRDFPDGALAPYRVRSIHPEALLLGAPHHHPAVLQGVIAAQGRGLRPPRTTDEVLDRLARDVPRFAARARVVFSEAGA